MERIIGGCFLAELAVRVVGGIAVDGHGDDIVIGFRAGKITSKTDRGNHRLLTLRRKKAAQDQADEHKNKGPRTALERLYGWGRASLGRNAPGSELAKKHVERIMPKCWRRVMLHTRWRSSVAAVCKWQIAIARASAASGGSGISARFSSRVTMCCTCCFSARP